MSIRSKILLAFVSLILLSLGVFFYVASDSFRKDKLAYIYDSNQILTEGKSYAVLSVLSSWKNVLQALSPYIAVDGQSIAPNGLMIWNSIEDLRELRISGEKGYTAQKASDGRPVVYFRFAKEKGLQILGSERPLPPPPTEALPASGWWIDGSFRAEPLKRVLSYPGETSLVLVNGLGHSILPVAPAYSADLVTLASQIELGRRQSETVQAHFQGQGWFLGIYQVPQQNLKILAFTPQSILSRLLQNLLIRGLVVCCLVMFLVLGITVLLSRGITRNLETLNQAVRTIGKGNFDFKLNIRSRDETANLATAFTEMSNEIKTLLVKTADQSRMEEELKTGKLVQSTLFPFEGMASHQVEIKGFYQSATECGGDWWYYKYQAGFLYAVIADATGHGVPAALITSAARAAFSLVEWQQGPTAAKIALDLNRAIFNVSAGQVLMTALVVKLNVATGHMELANCSHEAMVEYDGQGEGKMILPAVSQRLGEKEEMEIEIEHLFLESGHSLFLYTDGIKDLKAVGKRALSDRQLLRMFKRVPIKAEDAVAQVLVELELSNQEAPLKDDVTFVIIHRV